MQIAAATHQIVCHAQVDGNLKLEVQAHSRMLCAIDIHPSKPIFATAAEDATFAVWGIPHDGQEVC